MTKEILIKSAIRALVNEQVKQGSWGYALEEDSAYEVSWKDVLEWLELQPSKDCISREDILNSFKEIKFYTNHRGMRAVELVDVIDCVLDAPSVQTKTRWIPCSERLPEDGVYVLGQSKLGGINIYQKNKEIRPTGICGGWFADDTWYSTNFIIAWMPLPTPYKAESEK